MRISGLIAMLFFISANSALIAETVTVNGETSGLVYSGTVVVGTTSTTAITTRNSVTVPAGSNVTYQVNASGLIRLLPGFRAVAGAKFTARTVVPVPTKILISGPASVLAGSATAYSASLVDQFGVLYSPQPIFTWSVTGGGTINGAGLFAAGAVLGGPHTIKAKGSALSGTTQVNIFTLNPYVMADPATTTGLDTYLKAINPGGDIAGRIYTWKQVGVAPATVTFSDNGTTTAKTTKATFTKAGRYIFQLNDGTTGDDYVVVTVQAKPSKLEIVPKYHTTTVYDTVDKRNEIVIEQGGIKTLGTKVSDQFGNVMENKFPAAWSENTSNSISQEGVFTGTSAIDTTVTATAEGLNASVIISPRAKNAITQVWIEAPMGELKDVANIKLGGRDLTPTALFRVNVINPKYQYGLCTSGTTTVAKPGYKSSVFLDFSGTANQGGSLSTSESFFDYSATIVNYGNCNGYPTTALAAGPTTEWLHTSQPIGLAQHEVYDPVNLFFAKPVYGVAYHNNRLTEGHESIVATIRDGQIPGEIYITPEGQGKNRTVTTWIRKDLYTNTGPSLISSATATAPISSDVNLGNAPLSKLLTMSSTLSVVASDNRSESQLTYRWETIDPPAPVVFSANNGTNAGKAMTVTFAQAGTYKFRVTITDSEGASTTSQTTVIVKQAATSLLKVIPEKIAIIPGQSVQFAAVPVDQFGDPITQGLESSGWKPTKWQVTGGGTINQNGLFTAGNYSGQTFVVTASGAPLRDANTYVPPAPTVAAGTWPCSGKGQVFIANPPVINLAITKPAAGSVITTVPFTAEMTVTGDIQYVEDIRLAGILLGFRPTAAFTGSVSLSPPDGPYTLTAEVFTAFGQRLLVTRDFEVAARPLDIAILSPPDFQVFNQQRVFVNVRRPTLTTNIAVQGAPATARGFESGAWVTLQSGRNTITATGADGTRTGSDTVELICTLPSGYNPNGDSDGDGIINSLDLNPNNAQTTIDTDSDGVTDDQDAHPTNPLGNGSIIITNPPPSKTYRLKY